MNDRANVVSREDHVMTAENSLTRRHFLQTSAAGSLSGLALAEQRVASAADDDLLIIDCHAHIYGEDEKKYPTIEKPYRPPKGKGTIRHLQREMKASGVRHVTAIQTSTFYRFDNRFTSDSARDNSEFLVGVVTLDPDDSESPAMLRRYVKDFNVRGMRSIPAKSGRLDDPGVDRLWATAEELGIVINVLTNREKRGEVEALAKRHPKLRIVIDHCLNIKAGPEPRRDRQGCCRPGRASELSRQAVLDSDGHCGSLAAPGPALFVPQSHRVRPPTAMRF
ncbi:MAG: amidohydrolase family protein [Planctomycetes bacterium]|nr:amidohydrolase family protein [Planctomycetota bacterium]